jgi:glycopeptide antibiotics resistance protein
MAPTISRVGLMYRWTSIRITLFGILIIFIATLFPFNFLFKETFQNVHQHFFLLKWGESSDVEILENILLFLPLGFGLTGCLIQGGRLARLLTLGIILMVSFGFSYSMEILQVFLPSRFPSLIDVFSNSVGGLVGFILYHLWKTLPLSGYVTLVFLIALPLQLQTTLHNWDESFPLLLGNERTKHRPWQGYISEVCIADRGISQAEVAHAFSGNHPCAAIEDSLLALYRLTGPGSYHDAMGRLPDLVWRGAPQDVLQRDASALLGPNQWLETATPATYLTQRLRQTSQFTLGVRVATNSTIQSGPARIVSLSGDPSRRNFTLGQQGSDLIFRLRTPLTGGNGVHPALIVPGVFSTKKPVNLVMTYDGSELLLYVNGVRTSHTLELTPGAAAFSYLFPLDASRMRTYKILYYATMFIPLGMVLSWTVNTLRKRWVLRMLFISGGLIFPSLMLESMLVGVSGREGKLGNILLSMSLTACPMVLFTFVRCHAALKRFVGVK